jgi:glycosyltransferase involved in cell wall biosynthesis
VVLEAQASGLPVVISGTGGPRENMVVGRTGTVCHRDDPDEWASAIASVLRDESRQSAMRVAARQYALTRTWELAMQPLYRTYFDAHMRRATATPSDAVQAAAHGI